eukprot:GHRR01030004.1.p1 GENE.GHRR01030004.1~~GHRR01030004.1.p1  ORF type:complete len:114 (-),score=21.73 GHRR01030004.1:319-660(-)
MLVNQTITHLNISTKSNMPGITLLGMQVSCQGYSQKLPVLLDLLLDQLAAFVVKPDRFAVVQEALAREYANTAYQQPYQWAMYRAEVGPRQESAHITYSMYLVRLFDVWVMSD